jgi:hypothetical protein
MSGSDKSKEGSLTRILVFSPNAAWQFHFAYESTIAKGCQVRNATVEYIICEGLLPECDMHWDSKSDHPRAFNLCQHCREQSKLSLSAVDLPYKWLGELVSHAELEHTFAWAQSLPPSELSQSSFMGYPLGDWVLATVISYFRQYPPDMTNWRVVNVYRGFLFSAAILTIGLRHYLETNTVDAALLFNGRQSLTRVALEIFRSLGIGVLTHERPEFQRGHLNLRPNAHCLSISPFSDFWRKWGQVPLTRSSLETALKWSIDRRYGRNLGWHAFNAPFASNVSVREKLNLSKNKRLIALFTSSVDEIAGDPGWQGPYESQDLWVRDVVDWARGRNDIELVIRVHPNLSGNFGIGTATAELSFYKELKSILPDNVRLVMPDDFLNSYALIDEADIGLTFGSTIGIEMAMLGKPVVLGSRAFYEDVKHFLTIDSKQSLPEILEKSLRPFSPREIRRHAFRWAYRYAFVFEVPFPLISAKGVHVAELNYDSPACLAPGLDNSLDRACNFLIKGYPLHDSPTEAELALTTVEEDAFFAELEQSPEPFRDLVYERWLWRATRLDRFARTIKNFLERLPFMSGDLFIRAGKAVYLPLFRRAVKKV